MAKNPKQMDKTPTKKENDIQNEKTLREYLKEEFEKAKRNDFEKINRELDNFDDFCEKEISRFS